MVEKYYLDVVFVVTCPTEAQTTTTTTTKKKKKKKILGPVLTLSQKPVVVFEQEA